MNTIRRRRMLLALTYVAMSVGVSRAAEEKPVSVAGDWALTVEGPGGTRTPSVTLEQDGGAVTGVYHGRRGDSPLGGTVVGKVVDFNVKLSLGGQELTLNYHGTVVGDDMTGKVTMGERGESTFTGKRK